MVNKLRWSWQQTKALNWAEIQASIWLAYTWTSPFCPIRDEVSFMAHAQFITDRELTHIASGAEFSQYTFLRCNAWAAMNEATTPDMSASQQTDKTPHTREPHSDRSKRDASTEKTGQMRKIGKKKTGGDCQQTAARWRRRLALLLTAPPCLPRYEWHWQWQWPKWLGKLHAVPWEAPSGTYVSMGVLCTAPHVTGRSRGSWRWRRWLGCRSRSAISGKCRWRYTVLSGCLP